MFGQTCKLVLRLDLLLYKIAGRETAHFLEGEESVGPILLFVLVEFYVA